MKIKSFVHLFETLCVAGTVATLAYPANASGADIGKERTYSGTITSLNTQNKTLRVHGFLLSKSFVLSDSCTLTKWDKNGASLGDFRPGQKVEITYKDASGVLVADQVAQEALRFSGTVSAIDVNGRTLTVHSRGGDRTFKLADNCRVMANGKNDETLGNVRWGERVNIVYEIPGDQRLAREINIPGKIFTGSLDAINADDHSISAGKRYLKDHKFYLANDCVIIANGKANGQMSDLRLGQNYEFNYESVGGINVVNRIGPASTNETPGPTAQAAPEGY